MNAFMVIDHGIHTYYPYPVAVTSHGDRLVIFFRRRSIVPEDDMAVAVYWFPVELRSLPYWDLD